MKKTQYRASLIHGIATLLSLICIASIFHMSQLHATFDATEVPGQYYSADCVRKAIGVIEIAAQQDKWYAHFLRGLLSLKQFPEEHARDIVLIAHMALTQSLAMNKPLPLALPLQKELIDLFGNSVASAAPIESPWSEISYEQPVPEKRCLHCGLGVPYPPISNPSKRPGTCICYDLYVQNQAVINSLIVTGTERIGGSLIVDGDIVIDGSLVISGTFVVTNLVVDNNASIGGDLTVDGLGTISTLVVTNSATIDGGVNIGGALNVTGPTALTNLTVINNESIGGNLTVTGSGSFSTLTVTNTASVGSDLIVGGALTVTGPTTLTNLTVTNNESIGGNLNVAGSGNFSNLTVTGTSSFSNLIVTGTSFINGNLIVTGTGVFSGLVVTGTEYVGGDLHVNGLLYLNQSIPPNNIAFVQKSPVTASNQFNSISAALAAISSLTPPSASNPYTPSD